MKKLILAISILFLTAFCYSDQYWEPKIKEDVTSVVQLYMDRGWPYSFKDMTFTFYPEDYYYCQSEIKEIYVSQKDNIISIGLCLDPEQYQEHIKSIFSFINYHELRPYYNAKLDKAMTTSVYDKNAFYLYVFDENNKVIILYNKIL